MPLKRLPYYLLSLPTSLRQTTCLQCRPLHRLNAPTLRVPKPTPFVPDVQTFLTLIGRGLSQHAAKFSSWEALFSLSSQQLRESGVEPARARRYLLWWRERFRNGIIGIGGDLAHVKDGVAELKIVEVPSERSIDRTATLTKNPGMRKVIVNHPAPAPTTGTTDSESSNPPKTALAPPPNIDPSEVKSIAGFKMLSGTGIGGRGVQAVKGRQGVAMLKVQEGLWEQRRGHKVDGGERRRAEVRAKRRAAERKAAK